MKTDFSTYRVIGRSTQIKGSIPWTKFSEMAETLVVFHLWQFLVDLCIGELNTDQRKHTLDQVF